MKISSKSILSPGRAGVARDAPSSLSTSVSRRLRNSGSIKGGASPAMFPTTAKKRGSFENPEPSSPKVTCIGQVRVKSKKKQAKKLRTLSRRHSAGEVSFRSLEHPLNGFASKPQNLNESLNLGSNAASQNQNQEYSPPQRSWVHFPVTICDALRAFGSEFSCLFPCRKDEKTVSSQEGNRQGCAVFARWLVTVQDEDGGGERDIELVVGGEEEEEEEEEFVVKKSRRHVFEDLEIINDRIEGHKDEARVSICVPPKNALLLMRGRSEPIKLFSVAKDEEEDYEELVDHEHQIEQDLRNHQVTILDQQQENAQLDEAIQDQKQENVRQVEAIQDREQEHVQHDEAIHDQERENVQDEGDPDQEREHVEEYEVGQDQEEESMFLEFLFEESVNQDFVIQEHEGDSGTEEAQEEASTMVTTEVAEISATHGEEMVSNGVLERESEVKEEKERERVLPECLLMMMYEPKLSMEVSKETWVCSTDFIRRNSNKRKPPPPPPPVVKTDGEDESKVSTAANAFATVNNVMRAADGGRLPPLQQPARSSCSLPGPPSMATMLEQKLADAMGYEPFVLTRCKSEPMKTAAAKLIPESCVWENRKVERLSRGTFGVGAAGYLHLNDIAITRSILQLQGRMKSKHGADIG
ncbi:hypothetical protein LXL04_001949 [Taraxacum kok-saghyz]